MECYQCKWLEPTYDPKETTVSLDFFCAGNGYEQSDIASVTALDVGESVEFTDHTVTRLENETDDDERSNGPRRRA